MLPEGFQTQPFSDVRTKQPRSQGFSLSWGWGGCPTLSPPPTKEKGPGNEVERTEDILGGKYKEISAKRNLVNATLWAIRAGECLSCLSNAITL